MTFVSEIEPKVLWQHFDRILTIPRGSGKESAIREYVREAAAGKGLEATVDRAGNLIVIVPASSGMEQAPSTILQCHLDMVNEKRSTVSHDFERDPIVPKLVDGYLTASGTTLGSDNGIGIAACLAIMESDSIRHGPLELLFTVDEETGMTGAAGLETNRLKGRFLINLDSEEEGTVYVGCAGGAGLDITLPMESEAVACGQEHVIVAIGGLRGGHSGVDIHLQRGNAIQILARGLNEYSRETNLRLASLQGGNMHNAIPREASAVLAVSRGDSSRIRERLQAVFEPITAEFGTVEPEIQLRFSVQTAGESVFDNPSSARALALLVALPHGVAAMSSAIPRLVETSSNLASVLTRNGSLEVHVSCRSSSASSLRGILRKSEAIAELAGARVVHGEGYPGWQPDVGSQLLTLVRGTHRDLFGQEPAVKAIHAGLECGLIRQKYPSLDMLSVGPQIEFPHSPEERVHIGSVGRFLKFLEAILQRIAVTV